MPQFSISGGVVVEESVGTIVTQIAGTAIMTAVGTLFSAIVGTAIASISGTALTQQAYKNINLATSTVYVTNTLLPFNSTGFQNAVVDVTGFVGSGSVQVSLVGLNPQQLSIVSGTIASSPWLGAGSTLSARLGASGNQIGEESGVFVACTSFSGVYISAQLH